MQIAIPTDKEEFVKQLAISAGFSSVDQYIFQLIEQDSERKAIRQALDELDQGLGRPFEEFDAEFRAKHGLPTAG